MSNFLDSSFSIVAQDAGPQPTANELRNALEVCTWHWGGRARMGDPLTVAYRKGTTRPKSRPCNSRQLVVQNTQRTAHRKRILAAMLAGDPLPQLLMPIIRFVMPSYVLVGLPSHVHVAK